MPVSGAVKRPEERSSPAPLMKPPFAVGCEDMGGGAITRCYYDTLHIMTINDTGIKHLIEPLHTHTHTHTPLTVKDNTYSPPHTHTHTRTHTHTHTHTHTQTHKHTHTHIHTVYS